MPRKELRKSRDIVRLSSSMRVDGRALAFEAPWFGSATESERENDAEMEDASAGEEDDDGSTESDARQASVPARNDDDDGDVGNASDDDEAHEHVNMDGDGNEQDKTLGNPTRKRKLPPSSSSKPHVDPAAPNQKKVAFAALPSPSKPRASTKAAAADKRKKTTPDLANNKKAKIGLGSSSTRSIKPAANAPTAAQKRKNQTAAAATSEEGAYDFSKFF